MQKLSAVGRAALVTAHIPQAKVALQKMRGGLPPDTGLSARSVTAARASSRTCSDRISLDSFGMNHARMETLMSDDLLRIIPTDQKYIPDDDRQQRALGLLKTMCPDADEHEATVYDELTFIDQGVNCEAVLCPSCGVRLKTGDDDWWLELQEQVADSSIADVQVTMPCCGNNTPFTSLRFDWSAGFAHFELCVQNPRVDDNLLGVDQLKKLQDALNCDLTQIRAHI